MRWALSRRALYESWVHDHAADLYRSALRLCGQPETAEELVQETYYEAWRSIDSLRDTAKGRAWLHQILRHRYAHWVRDQKRHPRQEISADTADSLASSEDGPQEVLARREALQQALDALDDRYKLPFLLVFLEGLTCQEAAHSLEVRLGTVLSRIHRARQFLRGHLESGRAESGHLRLHTDRPDLQGPNAASGGAP